MKKTLSFVLMTLLLVVVPACREKPLWNPGSVAVATSSREHMRNAIDLALRHRGWAIAKEEPGRVEATLYIRSHVANIAIEYDDKQYNITYLDSQNLKYRKKADGTEWIHGNYNEWIENLVRDISVYASHNP